MNMSNVRWLISLNVMALMVVVVAFWSHDELQSVPRGDVPFLPSIIWFLSAAVIAMTLLTIAVGHGTIGMKLGGRLTRRRSGTSSTGRRKGSLVAVTSFVALAYMSLSYDSAVYDLAGWSAWAGDPIIVVGFEVGLWVLASPKWKKARRITSEGVCPQIPER